MGRNSRVAQATQVVERLEAMMVAIEKSLHDEGQAEIYLSGSEAAEVVSGWLALSNAIKNSVRAMEYISKGLLGIEPGAAIQMAISYEALEKRGILDYQGAPLLIDVFYRDYKRLSRVIKSDADCLSILLSAYMTNTPIDWSIYGER